jgi:hypothetical protein
MSDVIFYIIGLIIALLISYFIIKAAVTEGMKEHTRWQVANRAEIEAKYAKPRQAPGDPAKL